MMGRKKAIKIDKKLYETIRGKAENSDRSMADFASYYIREGVRNNSGDSERLQELLSALESVYGNYAGVLAVARRAISLVQKGKDNVPRLLHETMGGLERGSAMMEAEEEDE